MKINLFLGWLTRQDLIDMWFKLVLIKRSKKFLIGFFNLFSLFSFKYVTNSSSKPIFHSELEDKISSLSMHFAKLETLFLLSLSEICITWKCWSSYSVFLLFLFFTKFRFFFQLQRSIPCCSLHGSWIFLHFLFVPVYNST